MKKISMLAMAAGALLMGSQSAQVSSEAAPQSSNSEAAASGAKAQRGAPAPAKPAGSPAQQQRVYVKARPTFPAYSPVRYFLNHPRRVRYGKSRWVILG